MNNTKEVKCGSYRPAIVYIANNLGQGLIGAEIGVEKGLNALFIINIIQPKMLYLIDPWNNFMDEDSKEIIGEAQYLQTLHLLKDYSNKTIIRKTSLEAVDLIKEELDFIYIDGDHSYSGVYCDISKWYPKVKQGGIIAGHDFLTFNVEKAVKEFIMQHKIPKLYTGQTDWWFVKE